jgi:3-hydroxyacyl-[acyl-carrier-protein] dehydratase
MRGETHWRVPPDHPAFAGHFPGAPIVPGVVLLDEAILAIEAACGRRLLPGQLAAVKFLHPVGPGTDLHISYASDERGVRLEIAADGRRVASAHLVPAQGAAQ